LTLKKRFTSWAHPMTQKSGGKKRTPLGRPTSVVLIRNCSRDRSLAEGVIQGCPAALVLVAWAHPLNCPTHR
jgi:hypothetical protein